MYVPVVEYDQPIARIDIPGNDAMTNAVAIKRNYTVVADRRSSSVSSSESLVE